MNAIEKALEELAAEEDRREWNHEQDMTIKERAEFIKRELEKAAPAKVVEGATGESRAIRDGWNDCRAKLGLSRR